MQGENYEAEGEIVSSQTVTSRQRTVETVTVRNRRSLLTAAGPTAGSGGRVDVGVVGRGISIGH